MEREGVIKFNLEFEQRELSDIDISEIRAWRQVLVSCGLIGQEDGRYGGLGFGNLSMRTTEGFLISGTQTGHLPDPGLEGYALVTSWQLNDNVIRAKGMVKPSSESLTHAAVYALDETIRYVYHVHSPSIWLHAEALGLPMTDRDCAYGTPEMAQAVATVARGRQGVFAMAGHVDGVVAYGAEPGFPGQTIVGLLARGIASSIVD